MTTAIIVLSHLWLFVCGFVAGKIWVRYQSRRAKLPPTTRKQIRRTARANRLEVLDGGKPRRAVLFISPTDADFDREDTR